MPRTGIEGGAVRLRPRLVPDAGRQRARAVHGASALLLLFAAATIADGLAPVASAHEPGRLVVEPQIARPGESLTIHAEALWTEVPVTVAIVDAAGEREIATGATSDAGALEVAARLPDDVQPGTWEIVVENDAGEHVEGQVVVRSPDRPVLPIAAGIAVLAVVAVVVAVVVRRRRGRQAAASSSS